MLRDRVVFELEEDEAADTEVDADAMTWEAIMPRKAAAGPVRWLECEINSPGKYRESFASQLTNR